MSGAPRALVIGAAVVFCLAVALGVVTSFDVGVMALGLVVAVLARLATFLAGGGPGRWSTVS